MTITETGKYFIDKDGVLCYKSVSGDGFAVIGWMTQGTRYIMNILNFKV